MHQNNSQTTKTISYRDKSMYLKKSIQIMIQMVISCIFMDKMNLQISCIPITRMIYNRIKPLYQKWDKIRMKFAKMKINFYQMKNHSTWHTGTPPKQQIEILWMRITDKVINLPHSSRSSLNLYSIMKGQVMHKRQNWQSCSAQKLKSKNQKTKR